MEREGQSTAPSRRPRRARWVQLAVGLVVSALLLWLAFRDVALGEVLTSMRSADPAWVIATLLASYLGIYSRAQRWVPLFGARNGVTAWDGFVAQSIGFAGNAALPFRAGEGLKILAMAQRTRRPFALVLATVLVERVLDLVGVGVTLAIALAVVPIPPSAGAQISDVVGLLKGVTVVGVASVIAFLFLRRRALRLLDSLLAKLTGRAVSRVRAATHAFVEGLDNVARPRQILPALCLTVWVWATLAIPFAFMSRGFGFDRTYGASSWMVGIVCSAIVAVFVMVPAAPGFVGTYQAGCIAALSIFGVPREGALAFSLMVHFLTLVPPALTGLGFALRDGVVRDLRRAPRFSSPEGGGSGLDSTDGFRG
ncbi:MAG: flippase-like domain-containing protein [Acidobacteria bacterium]|nr:flippase-like domain-containing protein [Acidobacteriota bacterium]